MFGPVSPIVVFPPSCDQSCDATRQCPWETDPTKHAGGVTFRSTTIVIAARHQAWLSRMWDGRHSHSNTSRYGVPSSLADISGQVRVVDRRGCVQANVGPRAHNVTVNVTCSSHL